MNPAKRIFNNFIPLFLLKGFEYLLPLLTLPFLVRVLGQSGYGSLSLAMTSAYFFSIITNYGFEFTATREVSIYKSNKSKLNEYYSTVLISRVILLLISFTAMNLFIMSIPSFRIEWHLYYLAFLYVIGNTFFPVWLFQGIEKTKYITIVNIVPRSLFTILIFIVVKNPEDIIWAILLQSAPIILTAIMSLYIVRCILNIKLVSTSLSNIIDCLREGIGVFLSSIMTYVVASSGILILGIFASKEIVGIYSSLEKLTKAVIGIFGPFFQALFPFVSEKFNNDYDKGLKFLVKISKILLTLSAIITVFIVLESKWMVITIFGLDYYKYGSYLQIFSFWIFLSVLNNCVGIQYLIATRQQKIYNKSFMGASITVLVLFFMLVPLYNMLGTIISIVIGELILSILMFAFIFNKKVYTKSK